MARPHLLLFPPKLSTEPGHKDLSKVCKMKKGEILFINLSDCTREDGAGKGGQGGHECDRILKEGF